jgi:hypothetical protein
MNNTKYGYHQPNFYGIGDTVWVGIFRKQEKSNSDGTKKMGTFTRVRFEPLIVNVSKACNMLDRAVDALNNGILSEGDFNRVVTWKALDEMLKEKGI